MSHKIVFISSPYSGCANKLDCVQVQIDVSAMLMMLGFQPIAPLLSHYIGTQHSFDYGRWMEWCLTILERCDCVLRLPGKSKGGDEEVAFAKRNDIPVFYSIDELIWNQSAAVNER